MKLSLPIQFLYTTLLFSLIAAGVYGLSERVDFLTVKTVATKNAINDLHFETTRPICAAANPCSRDTLITWKIEDAARASYVDAHVALAIAQCESNLNPYAANPNSSAKGLYQFTDPTWREINAPGHQFDVDENIKQFMIWYPIHPEWWECE